ncbi:MAG: GP88 family protein [Porticoccaceae bacterium]
MKLLSINASNTKIAKTQNGEKIPTRLASLSLYPDDIICAGSKAAKCQEGCLVSAGRGRFDNVANARRAKTAFFHADQTAFMDQLKKELSNFDKLCKRQNVRGVVRLNTISDIAYEQFGIPQSFPDLDFYDYTKRVNRIGKTPDNYKLMFSYSGAVTFRNQVAKMPAGYPMAVVFRGELPTEFMGRKVIDGDVSDLDNLRAGHVVVGLRAKGKAKKDTTGFVVDSNLIALGG